MGSGTWSTDTFSARDSARKAAGKDAFDYSAHVLRSTPRSSWASHPDLNPHGVKVRESCDSDEHPNSTAIAVVFDVTGSMQGVPPLLQQKLPALFGLLLRKGYVPDPQIMMGAVTDAVSERIVLQLSQFESDNRIDENLEKIILEGGGGGGNHESYELVLYFMARHTAIDCFSKHGRKGYLFIIGDECAYPTVSREHVLSLIGDTLERDIPIEEIMTEVKRRYHVFYLHPEDASYVGDTQNIRFWTKLLGQNYVQHVETDSVCETIATLIGLTEGSVADLTEAGDNLMALGASSSTVSAVTKAVTPYAGTSTGVTAKGSSSLPSLTDSGDGSSKTRRL